MLTIQLTAAEPLPLVSNRAATVWLTVAVLATAFFFIEHTNSQVSNLEAFTLTGDEASERAAEGDMGRRFAIPGIALFGAMLLMRRDGTRVGLRSRLGWLLLGYITWCGMSILWSSDPSLTLRRFSVLMFCSIGALGIARQLSLRDLCLVTLITTTMLVMNGVRTEVVLGTFHPFSSEYRFAGTVHPNVQAPYCATMALAAACLLSRAKRGRLLLWALCLTAIVLLVLTKSRTVCGAFVAGMMVYYSFNMPWPKKIAAVTAILWAGCTVALIVSLLGWDIERLVVNAVLIGRQDEAESLSGRVPLWAALVPHVQDHFLFGHGYLTFWSPQRIESFSRSFQWTVPDGHCAFLDTFLDLGLIGAGLCLMAIVIGVREVAHRCLNSSDVGYGFLLALLVCRSLNGVLESAFSTPTTFGAFIMVCGLAHLGFCSDPEYSTPLRELSKEVGR